MLAKFRFYIFLTSCSGLAFFLFYKALHRSNDETTIYERSTSHLEPATPPNKQHKLYPMKNVNELLSITQPSHHLQKQKLREAEVHAKIKQQALQRQFGNFGLLNNVSKNYLVQMHPSVRHRIVHLDLKGAPPTIQYLLKLFPLMKELHATGLLIEYEDMFPYWGDIDTFKAFNAYSRFEIQQLLAAAKQYDLEVIPLIQTFGHLEFVLKQLRHSHLREVPEYPQVICPSRNESQIILRKMVDQMIELHPSLKWLHIGADEVYYIGRCALCQARMQKEKMETEALFLDHVTGIAKYVKEKYNVQPIMWDDMFRQIPTNVLQEYHIHKYVELMVWKYTPNLEEDFPPEMWEKYVSLFPGIWVASAFKGAIGADQQMPNIEYYLDNQYAWLKIMAKYQNQIPFRGLVLTGWQRYDHFALLCELLPASIPSLAISLTYIQEGKIDSEILDQVNHRLGCQKGSLNLTVDSSRESRCSFPGAKVFRGIQRLTNLKNKMQGMERNSHMRGWVTNYHVRMNFGSPAHVEIATKNLSNLTQNATLLYTYMENVMGEMFDKYTIQEWLLSNMDPIIQAIRSIRHRSDSLKGASSWPRRPLVDSNEGTNKRETMKELASLNRAAATDL